MPQSPASNDASPGALFSIERDRDALVEAVGDPDYADRLEALVADDGRAQSDRLRALLRVGAERFGVEVGLLARVDPAAGTHTIVERHGPSPAGPDDTADLSTAYCRTVIAENAVLGVTNAPEQGWAEDAAYDRFGAATYFGAKVVVDGALYGTVSFLDPDPHPDPFGPGEAAALGLLADAVRRILEHQDDRPTPTRRQLEAVFEGSPVMINLHDLEGNLIAPNAHLCKKTGYTADELTEMNVWDLDQEVTPDRARANWADMDPGDRHRWEGRFRRKDGTTFPVEVDLRRLDVAGSARFAVTSRDITDRKAAERELARRNDLFAQAQELAHVGGWEYDVQTGEGAWTDELYRIYGLPVGSDPSPDEAIEHYHPEDRNALRRAFRRAVEEGVPYDLELRLIDADGQQRWVHTRGVPQIEDGEVVRLRGSVQDVTERRSAEAAVVDRQEKIRSLYETTTRLPRAEHPEEVATHLHDLLQDLFDYPVTAVNLRRGDVLVPEQASVEDLNAPPDIQPLAVEGDSVGARAYRNGEPVVVENVQALDNDIDPGALRGAAGVPIEGHGAVVVGRTEEGGFDSFLLRLVDILTAHAATVLDRIEREDALRAERNLLDRILETSPAAIVVLDTEGAFIQASGRAQDVLGLKKDAVTDRAFDDPEWRIRTPGGRPMPEEALPFRRVMATETPVRNVEHTIEWPDGTQRLLSVSGAPLHDTDGALEGAVFHLDDVTEERAAERELRSTKRLLEKTFESLDEVVLVVDPSQREIVACNSAVEKTFGYTREELIGHSTEKLHASPAAYERFGEIGEPILEAEGIFKHDYQMRRKDGELIETEHVVTPLEGDDWPNGVVSVIRDVTERRQAERNLRQREEQLRGLANSLPGVVFQFFARPDGTRGNYFVSKHARSVLGIEADPDTFFERFRRRVPEAHRERFAASVETAVEQAEPWRHEMPFDKPSGERIWLLGASTPIRREGELVYNGVLIDITERKAAERALQDERDRFATLFHNLPTPVVRGRADDEGQLRIRAVNAAFETTFGYDEDDARNEDIQALIVPEEERPTADSIRRRVLVGEPTIREVQREAADGRRDFRVQVAIREGDNGPVEGFAIYTDITERKERERALAQRTALLEAQAEATIDGLLAVDDDRRVVFHNDLFLTLWDLPVPSGDGAGDALPERRPLDALSDRVRRPDAFRDTVASLYDRPDAEDRTLIRRTDDRWLDQYSAPIVGDDGTHFGRLWVFRDVTEQRRMRERLLEVQEEERRRIDQEIHDEMGGLLTSLQFTVDLARRQAGDGEDLRESLDQVETLVSDLSTVARTISRKVYPSALSDYGLAGTLPTLADEMKEKRNLTVDLRVELGPQERFSSLVERTAYWIVQEALVNVARHAETDAARVAVAADADHLTLEIADEGVGFGADAPDGDNSFGLEGIRRRVERLDGNVEIASAPGEGTRITARLPLRAPFLDDE